ncbi:unnamed protein product [Ilex paraguariensis]|uniref:Senescence domain-containing protein n=1 Tax=Ilex paraguariensis TaxID=185542 RepID=A0ABC8SY20_9AQUA
MASHKQKHSLYPEVIQSNPESTSPFLSNPNQNPSSSSLYPSVDIEHLAENLFPDTQDEVDQQNPSLRQSGQPMAFESSEEVLIKIPGAIVHLIDRQQSIQLASGDFAIVCLRQNGNVVAVLARVGDEIQWPLAKDEAAVKLDESHYFFSLRVPSETKPDVDDRVSNSVTIESENLVNYGLTIASKGQDSLLKKLDGILEKYSAFSVQKVSEAVDGNMIVAKGVSPAEMVNKREDMERNSVAYWTTLAPNVEDYSGSVARMIAAGSGQVIKGILWCGDVTVDRLRWGNEFLKKRIGQGSNSNVSPEALKRMKRVKMMTKMSEKVATGILSGVVKVSGFFTSPIVNSQVGQKFFSLLPGEIVLASLEGFNKVFDAVELAGGNVMSTSSVVTTGLVSQRYGEQAAEVTHDGFGAAGHAIGTAWAVFKIRKALNPKTLIKPTTLAKAAVKANSAKLKAKQKK